MFSIPATIRRRLPLVIPAGVDFNLASWLVGQGVIDGNVKAVLPAGSIIGGTIQDGYAFTVGDISAYSNVVLDIEGEVQGMGGAANGGNGSHGLISTGGPLTLNVIGAIYGGGGGGGDGGLGATGSQFTGRTEKYNNNSVLENAFVAIPKQTDGSDYCTSDTTTPYQHCTVAGVPGATSDNSSWIGYYCGYTALYGTSTAVAGRLIELGNYKENAQPLAVGSAVYGAKNLYSVYVSQKQTGVSTIGIGGKGQGYEGAAGSGTNGSTTYRAGLGGNGGNGGAWNTAGISGTDGGNGTHYTLGDKGFPGYTSYYYRATLNTETTNFTLGISGGTAGIDINVTISATVNKVNKY